MAAPRVVPRAASWVDWTAGQTVETRAVRWVVEKDLMMAAQRAG